MKIMKFSKLLRGMATVAMPFAVQAQDQKRPNILVSERSLPASFMKPLLRRAKLASQSFVSGVQ